MRACEHFDDFYGNFYGSLWPSMRLALLSQPKYCALVNYLGDYENTCNMLRVRCHCIKNYLLRLIDINLKGLKVANLHWSSL